LNTVLRLLVCLEYAPLIHTKKPWVLLQDHSFPLGWRKTGGGWIDSVVFGESIEIARDTGDENL